MNINEKETILRETYQYKGNNLMENFECSNFLKSFVKDYEYFGEDTAAIYQAFYFLNEEETKELQKNIVELKEFVENASSPFLFEDEFGGAFARADFGTSPGSVSRTGGTGALSKPSVAPMSAQQRADIYSWTRSGAPGSAPPIATPPITLKDVAKMSPASKAMYLEKYKSAGAAPSAAEAVKILNATPQIAATAAPATATVAAKVAVVPGKTSIASKIFKTMTGVWNKIKGFFTGGIKSIGDSIKSGNFAGLLKIPLVQSALVVGGAAVAFKLIKKLLGKRAKGREKEIRASLQAQVR